MAAIIETKDLRKVYRIGTEKVVALDCINLSIEKGQVCCILGTSGSGKSTLLNQLAGLEKPTRGDVIIKGQKVSAMSEKKLAHFRQRNVGFVFQSYNLLQGMSAIDNVAIPLTFRGMAKRKRVRLAKEMLVAVGLGKRMKHNPNEMSGGQQQRVGIARAFVAKPDVVFADEPTGNLDTRTTREVMNMFLGFARDKQITIILVTHDQQLARYADRIVTIVDGNVVGDALNHSLYDVTAELTGRLWELGEQGGWAEAADLLMAQREEFGEGVPAQALENCLIKKKPDNQAWLDSLLDAAGDDHQLAVLHRVGIEAGFINKDAPVVRPKDAQTALPEAKAEPEKLELTMAKDTEDEPEPTVTAEPTPEPTVTTKAEPESPELTVKAEPTAEPTMPTEPKPEAEPDKLELTMAEETDENTTKEIAEGN